MAKEIEAKFLRINKDALRSKLQSLGFQLVHPEYVMRRKTFDCGIIDPGKNKWGRVRQEAGRITMTMKEVTGGGIDDTTEVELVVDDFDKACEFLEFCGMPAKAFQENTRELWRRGNVEATLDTWPGLMPFVEIEAPAEFEVRVVSEEIGFDFKSAVFGSVDQVYELEIGIPAQSISKMKVITFSNPPTAS